MDDVPRRQAITLRQLGITRLTTSEIPALLHQFGTRRSMNRAIDTSAAQQRGVRRVYDCHDAQLCDVALKRLNHL
jgi:hypothetical protein